MDSSEPCFRFDGERVHFVAHHNFCRDALVALRAAIPDTPDRLVGTAIVERA
jgi:hypothetical protein